MWFLYREVSTSSGYLRWAALLAHLSQRLIGELIVYPWSGARRLSFTVLKNVPLRNQLADQSQILCGASLGRGNEIFIRGMWVT